jgi:molybdopterin-guanine dinucleotide biosynthesis protein B
MAKLIAEFSAKGLEVAAIKHAHHSFDVDHEGRDSWRFREAGAGKIIVASPVRWAKMVELRGAPEPSLADLLAEAAGADIILVEGFKTNPHPKIEVRRREGRRGDPLAPSDASILAVASDMPHADAAGTVDGRPHFDLDDVAGISRFIADYIKLGAKVT